MHVYSNFPTRPTSRAHSKGRQVCLTMCKLSQVLETITKESDKNTVTIWLAAGRYFLQKLNDRQFEIHVCMHTSDLALNDFS